MILHRLGVTGIQNVLYRNGFVGQATALGLDGWVRNRADNSVEAVVQRPVEMVEAIVARREGSSASRVADIVASDDASAETLVGFAKRATV